MKYFFLIARDFFGICKKLNLQIASKWLCMIAVHLPSVLKRRDLIQADRAMGNGPFHIKYSKSVKFSVMGEGIFSGIREMYVRDTYLHNGDLAINDGDFVLDLGSNVGNFANLALAHGKSVKVIAVEPSRDLNKDWYRSISLNDGFSARSTLVSAFMGQMGELQNTIKETETYRDAAWLSEDDLISTCGLRKIDFLKCDIEGGEYGLLNKDSKILQMAQNIAIEIHQFAGNPGEFLEMLASQGFNIKNVQRAPDGTITALGSRNS